MPILQGNTAHFYKLDPAITASGTTVDQNTSTTLQVHANTPVTNGTPRYTAWQDG